MFCLQLIDLSCYSLVSIFHYKAQRVTATPYTPMFLLCPLKGRGYTGWCSHCTLMPRPSLLNPFTQTLWDLGNHDHYCCVLWLSFIVYRFDKRSFSSQSFLSSHTDLVPFSLAFYQTLWDASVSKTYSKLGAY